MPGPPPVGSFGSFLSWWVFMTARRATSTRTAEIIAAGIATVATASLARTAAIRAAAIVTATVAVAVAVAVTVAVAVAIAVAIAVATPDFRVVFDSSVGAFADHAECRP